VAVHDDVDLVLGEDSQVHFRFYRDRRAEHDVLQLGADHGAAPAVGKRAARALEHYVVHLLVDADGGAVQHLDDLAVYAAGEDAQLAPYLLALLGRPVPELQLAFLLSEHRHALLANVNGDLLDRPVRHLYPEVGGDLQQLYAVLDLVTFGFTLRCHQERVGDRPAVIGVGG
jgi:hypothetical protein